MNGAPRKLDNTLDPEIFAFRLHPDGGKVIYVQGGNQAAPRLNQIWVLENFVPTKK